MVVPWRWQVWGSSLGWLVFYAHLAYGWPAVGIELLPCLVKEAAGLAAQHGLEHSTSPCP